MEKELIIYPKGKAYIILLMIKYIFLIGLSFGFIFIEYLIPLILSELLILFLIALQTREIILYKMTISDSKIVLAANRDLYTVRHKKIEISYKNLKSLQYFLGFESVGFISAIVLKYDNEKIKYLDVFRFSDKQVDEIVESIKDFAEAYNNYRIEIKPDNIQKGFKRKR